ncbi:MAG: chitobiase/beta-hexosaminidase C-terminal domain-containing protein [Oscillospiraceae bacterium]
MKSSYRVAALGMAITLLLTFVTFQTGAIRARADVSDVGSSPILAKLTDEVPIKPKEITDAVIIKSSGTSPLSWADIKIDGDRLSPNVTYTLASDIVLNAGEVRNGAMYTDFLDEFGATFDGGNHTIYIIGNPTRQLTIDFGQAIGLFGLVNGGTIKNLRIKVCDTKWENGVSGYYGTLTVGAYRAAEDISFPKSDGTALFSGVENGVGIVAGVLVGGSIQNVEVYGSIVTTFNAVNKKEDIHTSDIPRTDFKGRQHYASATGGIVGAVVSETGNAAVDNCYYSGEIAVKKSNSIYIMIDAIKSGSTINGSAGVAAGGIAGIVLEPTDTSMQVAVTNCQSRGGVKIDLGSSEYIDFVWNQNGLDFSAGPFAFYGYAGGIVGYYMEKGGSWMTPATNDKGIVIQNCVVQKSAVISNINLRTMSYVYPQPPSYPWYPVYIALNVYCYAGAAYIANGVLLPSDITAPQALGPNFSNNVVIESGSSVSALSALVRQNDDLVIRTTPQERVAAKGAYTLRQAGNTLPAATPLRGQNDSSIAAGADMVPIINGAVAGSNWYTKWALDGADGFRQAWRRWDTTKAPFVEAELTNGQNSVQRRMTFYSSDERLSDTGLQAQELSYADQVRFTVSFTELKAPKMAETAILKEASPSLGTSSAALTLRPASGSEADYYVALGASNVDPTDPTVTINWIKYTEDMILGYSGTQPEHLYGYAVSIGDYAYAGNKSSAVNYGSVKDILAGGEDGKTITTPAATTASVILPAGKNYYVYTGPFMLHNFLKEAWTQESTAGDVDLSEVITIKVWRLDNSTGTPNASYDFKLGGKLQKPYFTPGQSAIFDANSKICIWYPAGVGSDYELFYTASSTGTPPLPQWTENTSGSGSLYVPINGTKSAVHGVPIEDQFEDSMTSLAIRAVAVPKNEYAPSSYQGNAASPVSELAEITYTSANRQVPANLRLTYKEPGSDRTKLYSPNRSYDRDTIFYLDHADFVDGTPPAGSEVYYDTIAEFIGGRYEPKYGITYDDLDQLDTVTLYAQYNKKGYPSSAVASFVISFRTPHGEAGYKLVYQRNPLDAATAEAIEPEALHRENNFLSFSLEERDIPAAARPADGVVLGYDTVEEYLDDLPQIRYSIATGATAPDTLSRTATPSVPELKKPGGEVVTGTPYTGTQIKVPGSLGMEPGEQVTINYQIVAKDSTGAYTNGPIQSLTLTIRDRLDPPKTTPGPDNPVDRGQQIELHTDQPGNNIKIYYIGGGETPQVEWDYAQKKYIPVGNTLEYTGPVKLSKDSPSIVTIRTLAVAVDDAVDYSAVATYRFNVSNLGKAPVASAYPATDNENPTALQRGEQIILRPSVAGYDIYYTTDGSLPNPDSYNPATPTATATRLYKDGIPMDPAANQAEFVVTAIVRDPTQTRHADSDERQFYYSIKKAAPPVAFPYTEETKVSVLAPGTVITLSSSTPNTTIYYTTDNSAPSPGSAGTLRYNTGSGIPMPSGKAFFTINAIARQETGSVTVDDSDIARFTYSPPTPVQAVYAMPSEGEVVINTEVTLVSGTEDARIFYELSHTRNSPDDPVPYESQPYDEKVPIIITKDTIIRAVAEKDSMLSEYTEYKYTVSKKAAEPSSSIPSGSVVEKGTRLTLSTSSGASITYTKDGSDPTKAENKNRMFGSDIVLDAEEGKSVSISAYATKAGLSPSEVVSFSYSISKGGDVLMANPSAGAVVQLDSQIILSTSLTGAEIHYTTDGSDPTGQSAKGSSITVRGEPGGTFLVKAIAMMGETPTTPKVFTYTIIPKTPAPSSSIPSGAITLEGAKAVLTVSEGIIYYTTDGSTPTTSSQLYTEPIAVSKSMVLKAIAVAEGKAPSDIAEYIYTMAGQVAAPTASRQSGQLEIGSQISLSTTTEGATIYYSTNGVDPSADNLKDLFVYDSPITISRPVTLKWIATKTGLHPSVLNSATYTVLTPEPEPEAVDEEEEAYRQTMDRLMNRHDFSSQTAGPLYEEDGMVIRDHTTFAVLSAPNDSFPENVQLVVEPITPSGEDRKAVRNELSFGILSMYDISVQKDGIAVQPSGPVEIGIPIPDSYQNAVIVVCYVDNNGSAVAYPTRRSGGMAYAEVEHFSKYAVTAAELDDSSGIFIPIPVLIAAGGAIAVAAAGYLLYRRRRKKS